MNEEKYGDRADVYSFGLLLWQLITAKVPYEHLNSISPRLAAQRVIGGERPAIPGNMNLKLKIIIENCWNEDPFFRHSISRVSTALHTLLSAVNESEPEPDPEPEPSSAVPTESGVRDKMLARNVSILINSV
ncbi:PREDICTED: dual specificity protein kinase shkC-like [Brassica oleracea var. oleracea]|uniref:dual specificity protein kinase shkC-like n=1 Tax=Brassica oleracea var. oleracea TaxID=109376 RepID=UPI0006A73CC9|nr:PREDICTED: dual specificity protein kinase shkC-like [Brassica oleracea var. oleracea]